MPPQAPPEPHVASYKSALLAVLLIAAAAIGAYALYHYFSQGDSPSPIIYATFGPTPVGEALMLDDDRFVAVASPDPAKQVVEVAQASARIIYLLGDATTLTTNLYEVAEDGELRAITDTPSLKFGVQFDESTGRFAYLSSRLPTATAESFQNAAWQLATFDEATRSEREIARVSGVPIAFHQGMAYLAVGADLIAVDAENGATRPILSIEPGSPAAISEDGAEIAIYSAASQALQFYSLRSGAPSFDREEPVVSPVAGLFYAGGKLWILGQGEINIDERLQHLSIGALGDKARAIESPYAFTMLRKLQGTFAR